MKVLVMSDTHCGHRLGLTPPKWWQPKGDEYGKFQRETWNWFAKETKKHGPFDIIIHNGDAIDGDGWRSGGTEQITTDRDTQAWMAARCIQQAMTEKTKVFMTYGTPYHTGSAEDFEKLLKERVKNCTIGSHEWVDINGHIFDLKHEVSSSGVPHGRWSPLAKEKLWNDMWVAEYESHPESDIIIRSHVHYYKFLGDSRFSGISTPALQGLGSKYGSRRCSGVVNYGFIVFNVTKEKAQWEPVLLPLKNQMPVIVKA